MKLKEIKELIELVNDNGFAEFEIKKRGFRLRISQFKEPTPHILQPASAPIIISSAIPGTPEISASGAKRALLDKESLDIASPDSSRDTAPVESKPDLHIIKSPIVGTFYSAPSPTSEPFVKTGDHIEPDTVVCIIEAMKLMNEIQAEVSGDIVRTYVENGQPVEYGQALFGIRV
jgi:acetyl-CoA carboxylase biotin carboxyl carrier protein